MLKVVYFNVHVKSAHNTYENDMQMLQLCKIWSQMYNVEYVIDMWNY